MMVAVAGCVAQAEGDEIMRRAPYVDMVFGPQSYHRLPGHGRSRRRAAAAPRCSIPVFPPSLNSISCRSVAPQGVTAFLTVQEGCDKFCSFCVVPYTRGAEYSRPVRQILR